MKRLGMLSFLALGLAACSEQTPIGPTSSPASIGTHATASAASKAIEGSYIVVFRNDVQNVDAEAQRLATKHAGKVGHKYKSALKGMSIELTSAQAEALRADPSVAYVE